MMTRRQLGNRHPNTGQFLSQDQELNELVIFVLYLSDGYLGPRQCSSFLNNITVLQL